ncbi:hypothetical protein KXV85_002672, partial [Aspergillus fumigatus]
MTPILKDHHSLEATALAAAPAVLVGLKSPKATKTGTFYRYISHLQRKVKILLDNAGLRLSTQA